MGFSEDTGYQVYTIRYPKKTCIYCLSCFIVVYHQFPYENCHIFGGTSIPSWTPGHWLISISCTTVSSSAGSTPEAGIAYLGPMGQGLTWSQASSWSHCFYRRSPVIFMHIHAYSASGVSEFQPQWIMNFLIQIQQRRIISRRESQVSRAFALRPNAPLRCQ